MEDKETLTPEELNQLQELGLSQEDIAMVIDISPLAVNKLIERARAKEEVLAEYSGVQWTQLSELQIRILSSVTQENINNASLRDKIVAFKVLKDIETAISPRGKDRSKGLLAYLILLQEELAKEKEAHKTSLESINAIEAEFEDVAPPKDRQGRSLKDILTEVVNKES
jgi:DNA-binding XRE family transcriptional regulator